MEDTNAHAAEPDEQLDEPVSLGRAVLTDGDGQPIYVD